MQSLLVKLFHGNIYPGETHLIETKELMEKRRRFLLHEDDFRHKLDALDPALSKKYFVLIEKMLDTLPLETTEAFIDGFKLGARIMAEVYQEDYSHEPD